MSGPKAPILAAGIAAVLGLSIYSMRTAKPTTGSRAQDKHDIGAQGAGLGGNAEVGATKGGRGNPAEKPGESMNSSKSTARKEELPSGGDIGGGPGKGGTNSRAVELPTLGSNNKADSYGGNSSQGQTGITDTARRWFGQTPGGDGTKSRSGNDQSTTQGKIHDTKGISQTGSETPSKK